MPKYILTFLLCVSYAGAVPVAAAEQLITGYIENITMPDSGLKYEAKLDTGADNSSINAEIISYEKATENAPEKVKFRLTDVSSQQKTFEKEVIRTASIKGKSPAANISRPVVQMEFCIENRLVTGEVNLADRRQFEYQVLIGRNMLTTANILVDSEETNLTEPNCQIVE